MGKRRGVATTVAILQHLLSHRKLPRRHRRLVQLRRAMLRDRSLQRHGRTLYELPRHMSIPVHVWLPLQHRGENPRRHLATLWSRLASPLTGASLATIAIAFFARTGARSRSGSRIVAAALLGVGFQMANGMLARALLLWGVPASLAAVALPSLTLLAGLLWLGGLPEGFRRAAAPAL